MLQRCFRLFTQRNCTSPTSDCPDVDVGERFDRAGEPRECAKPLRKGVKSCRMEEVSEVEEKAWGPGENAAKARAREDLPVPEGRRDPVCARSVAGR